MKFKRFAFGWEGQESSKRWYKIRETSSVEGVNIFGPFEISMEKELRKSERENKEKREREMQLGWLWVSSLFLVKRKAGEERWRSRVPVEVVVPLSFWPSDFTNYVFFSGSNFFNFPCFFFYKKQDMILYIYCSHLFWLDHFRAYEFILFICCGFVLVLVVLRILEWLFIYLFMISILSTCDHLWEILSYYFWIFLYIYRFGYDYWRNFDYIFFV